MQNDDTEPIVEVVVGQLGCGERTVRLGPGESIQQTFDEPSYVEVRVAESDDNGLDIGDFDVEDTTIEQEQTGDADREWDVETTRCQGCGNMYPASRTRCGECGVANPKS